jgi:hypothetical protein
VLSFIGINAFFNSNITSVKMGTNIVLIDNQAFLLCTMLSSVELPTSVTDIRASAFFETGLLNVVLPTSVVSLGNGAFIFSPMLSSITLTTGLTAIDRDAFGSNNFPPCNSVANTLIVPADLPFSVYSSVQFQCTVFRVTVEPSAVPTNAPFVPFITTLTAAVSAGDNGLFLASIAGLQVGDTIEITGGGNAEAKLISELNGNGGTVGISMPLMFSYPAGSFVQLVAPVAPSFVPTGAPTCSEDSDDENEDDIQFVTVLAFAASAGDTELFLETSEGLQVGDTILIGVTEIRTVSAIEFGLGGAPIIISEPLSRSFLVGSLVFRFFE